MLNFLMQNRRIRDQKGWNRVLISALTRFAHFSQPFRILAMLAALAFFIFLVLIPIARGQTYFSGTPQTVDTGIDGAHVGQYTSMAIVNSNPAISYYDGTNRDLMYVRANDANGASWGIPVRIDSNGDVGQWTSLKVINGLPAISYYDATSTNLKYVCANDEKGTTWKEPMTIDSTGSRGQHTSLALVAGFPAISYSDAVGLNLKYIRAADLYGDSWGTPHTPDSFGNTGQNTSLAVIAGRPAISYYENGTTGPDTPSAYSLRYVRAGDEFGNSWGTPFTVRGAGNVGNWNSLAEVNGHPAISYYDSGNGGCLNYIRAQTPEGATLQEWGPNVLLDNPHFGSAGQYNSLAVVDGKPAISYYYFYDGDPGRDLKYVRANDADGTSWGARITIDSQENVGSYTSLAVVNGNPAVSYFDAGPNSNLKYIRSNPAPTSATVSVSGRVLAGKDDGVGKAIVSLTGSSGEIRMALTNPFGYFHFDDVEVGQTYIISVSSKRWQFDPQVVFVTEDVADLDFMASP